jgi:hypothetical protein
VLQPFVSASSALKYVPLQLVDPFVADMTQIWHVVVPWGQACRGGINSRGTVEDARAASVMPVSVSAFDSDLYILFFFLVRCNIFRQYTRTTNARLGLRYRIHSDIIFLPSGLVLIVVVLVHTFLAALVIVSLLAVFSIVPFLAALVIVPFLAAFLSVPFLSALLIILVLDMHMVVVSGLGFGKYGKLW